MSWIIIIARLEALFILTYTQQNAMDHGHIHFLRLRAPFFYFYFSVSGMHSLSIVRDFDPFLMERFV